jgi:hypothetical protein
MADDIVGGLFGVNPDMYQQQQQQQVFNRAVALQNLNPFQQAAVGLQQAGYNFGGALGGAMGGVDPQLQRISALNAISKQIDQSNPESMLQGAKMLADAGFTQEALGLAQYARKANSELALAQQRMKEGRAAATPKEVQIAEYSANIKNQLNQLQAMEQTPEVANAINLLQSRLDALPQPKEAAVSANIQDSLEIGRLVGKIAELDKLPPDLQDQTRKKQLEAQLGSLTKNTKQGEFAQILQDAGFIPGSQEYKDKMTDFVNLKLAEKPETKTEALKNAIAFADFSSFKKGTREYNLLVQEKFNEYVAKPDKADKANIKEIGVSAKGDAVYLDVNKDEQFIFKIVDGKTVREPYAGKVDRAISSVSATANAPAAKQEEAFSVQRGKDQAQALADASTNARAASQAITSITSMKELDKTGQLVTGPLANSYVGASNLLASIGLLSKNQVSILTSSQVYDKSAKDLVMQDLGGKLGAQISDADRKFVEDRIPQLTTSAKARTELLDKIEQIQRGKIAYYGKMKAHANKNRNLDDFDFSEVYTLTPPVGSPAASSVKSKADEIIKGTK